MTRDEIERVVVEALQRIAPEVNGAAVDRRTALRDQVDLDSMDFLNFLLALHARLGVDIPESDYARLGTLEDVVAYLAEKRAGSHSTAPAPPRS